MFHGIYQLALRHSAIFSNDSHECIPAFVKEPFPVFPGIISPFIFQHQFRCRLVFTYLAHFRNDAEFFQGAFQERGAGTHTHEIKISGRGHKNRVAGRGKEICITVHHSSIRIEFLSCCLAFINGIANLFHICHVV